MAPRSILAHHEKTHILRQFSGRTAMSIRDLADRYGVSKAALGNILESGRTNFTSSLDITFDLFKTTSANLEVKEEAVSSGKEVGVSLKEKEKDASLAGEEKRVNTSLERGEVQGKRVKKEPVSLVEEEAGIPAVNENNTKAAGEDSALVESLLREISLHDSLPPPPLPSRVFGGEVGQHTPSRQELTDTLITLRRVVENWLDMPRWFTFVFDSMLPSLIPEEDVWSEVQWEGQGTVNLPSRQDLMSAVLVLRQALQNDLQQPAWFSFTLSRVLHKYRSRRRQTSHGSMFSMSQGSVSTSSFRWSCF